MQRTERQSHFGDGDVVTGLDRNHEEETRIRSAFVQLTRRVQIARADAERGRAPERSSPRGAHALQLCQHVRARRQVRENREIIAGSSAATQVRW